MPYRLCIGLALVLAAAALAAQEREPARREQGTTRPAESRIIVKLRAADEAEPSSSEASAQAVTRVASRARVAIRGSRRLTPRLHVVELAAGETSEAALERLRADSAVEYAELDKRRYIQALPDDLLYPGQWYWQGASETPSATDAEFAWNVTTGRDDIVVAVVDTGVLYGHPDLGSALTGGRLLPGRDFVSDLDTANDGDGRDGDASDPGDWLTSAEAGTAAFSGCRPESSSWHGTRVSGIINALTNNATGIAGGLWHGQILPVRVLGKCGGYDSDILTGLLWAGGIPISGEPANETPARILNLSFGANEACPRSYRDAIGGLADAGVLVVVSAGNDGGPVSMPANCPGVVAVAGLRHAGTKVGYSNLGPEVTIGAPAGNCVNLSGACLYSVDTTSNTGTTTPGVHTYTDRLDINVGTSFAAPIVSAITALMVSANGNLSPAQLIGRLQEGAKQPFPVAADPTVPQCHVPANALDVQPAECSCTTDTCGAGMANAFGAVTAALRPIAALALDSTVSPGQDVLLSAAGSRAACGSVIADYAWSVSAGGSLSSTDPQSAVVVAPATGSVTAHLTVTDDAGRNDSADIVIGPNMAVTDAPASAGDAACGGTGGGPTPAPAPTPTPSPTPTSMPSSSGGGGALGPLAWLALLAAALARRWLGARPDRARRACVAAAVALAFGLGLAGAGTETDLTGDWRIDAAASQKPAEVLRAAEAGEANHGSGVLRGIARSVSVFGIPVGSLPLPEGSSAGTADVADDVDESSYLLEVVPGLRILQTATATEIEYASRTVVDYVHGADAADDSAEVRAEWSHGTLAVRHELANGARIDETYSLDSPERLRWVVTIKAPKTKSIEIVRVYDRD